MGKGVSVSRRILRLQLGVNRKLTVVRWIGCATVGVVNTTSTRLKANEGAEKSCSKRRKRGQRKGSVRSRGCHPRRTPPVPAPVSDQPTSRTIARILRTYDHWGKRAKQFETLFSKTSHLGLFDRSSTSYPAWRTSGGLYSAGSRNRQTRCLRPQSCRLLFWSGLYGLARLIFQFAMCVVSKLASETSSTLSRRLGRLTLVLRAIEKNRS